MDDVNFFVGVFLCKLFYFYGREEMLKEIVRVFSEWNGKWFVVIIGLLGYGKFCLV